MQASQIPTRIPLPWANSGTKNTIPTASQIGITAGAASLTDGFPPLTFTPIASGGVPPAGADFNGILNLLSANLQWENAGGYYTYNAAFSTAIGGYPKGATLVSSSGLNFWRNTVDNNTNDPDGATPTGWVPMAGSFANSFLLVANTTLTAPQAGNLFVIGSGCTVITLPAGSSVAVGSIFEFFSGTATVCTIQRAGSDLFAYNTTTGTSTSIGAGDNSRIMWDGTNWRILSGSAQLQYATAFAASRSSNGYQRLPGGLILQWGSSSSGAGGTAAITLPIAVPTGIVYAGVTEINSGAGYATTTLLTSSGFTINYWTPAGGAAGSGISAQWFAVTY